MNLLARREHSAQELKAKLSASMDADEDQLNQVIEQLQHENLQSDSRFADAFVRSYYTKGKGPYRIRQELQQRGLSADVIQAALDQDGIDWFALAKRVLLKKYGLTPSSDYKETAKRQRFLQYRGFSGDHINAAMAADRDDQQ